MKHKDMSVQIKAGPNDGLEEGHFTAYASVFGNIDSYGDIVVKGAFEKDIARWEETGNPIPILFGHRLDDPDFNVGHVTKAVEDDHGLLITGQLDLEHPKAAQVYRLLKGRRVNQMSYAYDILDAEQVESSSKDGDPIEAQELRELKLYEVSVVTVGANEETEVLAVKANLEALAASAKAGRAISAKNEQSLRDARDAIDSVLSALGGDEKAASVPMTDAGLVQEEASGTAEATADASEQEPGAKSEPPATSSVSTQEPTPSPSVYDLAAETTRYLRARTALEGVRHGPRGKVGRHR